MSKEYYSATELCAKLGISKQSLWRYDNDAKVGLPRPVRIKSTRFYPITEVNQWLEQARG